MVKNKIREKRNAWASAGKRGEVVLYKAPDGGAALEVRLEQETVWLTLNQIADVFGRDKSVISRHLNNVFNQKELDRKSVVAYFATTASDGKTYQVEYFNLDAIISVGYRVNSRQGTQFRIWAANVLRDHLVKGYTANERRLKELRKSLQLVEPVLDGHEVTSDEARALLRVVTDYAFALDLLDDYDHQRIPAAKVQKGAVKAISYKETLDIIDRLREKFGASPLFGREKIRVSIAP